MKHTQLNYKTLAIGTTLAVMMVFAAKSAFSQGVADRGKPSSILTDNLSGPCDPQSDQADLVNGTDVNGNPVALADLPSSPVPLRGEITVPVKAQSGNPIYVPVDGKKLDPLLNPRSSCK